MKNVIDFQIKQFEREVFNKAQERAKLICYDCVGRSDSVEEYTLTLAMASGHALKFLKENFPDIWESIGGYIEAVAHGECLHHEDEEFK